VNVAQERERQVGGLDERLVTEQAIAADGDEGGAPPRQRAGDLSQAGQLGRSDASPVEAVEGDDDIGLAPVLLERDRPPERRGQREGGRGLSPGEGEHGASLLGTGAEGNAPVREVRPGRRARRRHRA